MSNGEECNGYKDNDLFHVHWCVCLCWRKAPLLCSLFSCVISHWFTLCFSLLCLCRLTWSQRARYTWSLICPDLPLRVKPPQHTVLLVKGNNSHIKTHMHTHRPLASGRWYVLVESSATACAKPAVMSLERCNYLKLISRVGCPSSSISATDIMNFITISYNFISGLENAQFTIKIHQIPDKLIIFTGSFCQKFEEKRFKKRK